MYNKQYVNTQKTKIRCFFFASRKHKKTDESFFVRKNLFIFQIVCLLDI